MIDIHITDKGVESHIENESAIDVMTALISAVFYMCKGLNFPVRTAASALIASDKAYRNKED